MWEKLSNSSLIFSKNFNKSNQDFYDNKVFIHRLYNYYINKGYFNLISTQIINIFISIFIVFFILFLSYCVDIYSILVLNTQKNIVDFIDLGNLYNINYFVFILLIFFFTITFMKFISVCDDLITYKTIKNYYKNTLEISDKELDYINWNDIIEKINLNSTQNLDIFYINNIICSKDNYFIFLLDNNIIDLYFLNNLMQWNLYFCIFSTIYTNNLKINKDIFTNTYLYSNKIKNKMRWISIFNFIFMPFILTLTTFYYLFNYGELFYNKPSLIISRGYNNKIKWNLRLYNELSHEFNNRITKSEKLTIEYISLFRNYYIVILSRLFIFLMSSVFIIFILFSVINDKILINLIIFQNKPVLWLIGILTPIIAIMRSYIIQNNNRKPKVVLKELKEVIYIDDILYDDAHRYWVYEKISYKFTYKMYLYLIEILSIIITPFNLWNLSSKSNIILNSIKKNTIPHNKLNYISNYSNFENYDYRDNFMDFDINKNIYTNFNKKQMSINKFCEKYKKWNPMLDKNIRINVI